MNVEAADLAAAKRGADGYEIMRGIKKRIKRVCYPFIHSLAWRLEPRSFALNALDKRLLPFLKKRHGVFVEAGANDGVRQSNTLFLERYLGWHGILIEPVPELAARCRVNRPNCVVVERALVSRNFRKPAVEIRYCDLMSVVSGAMGSREAEESHLELGRQFLASGEEPRSVRAIPATLTEVLDAHGLDSVDLLSLDVEGYELEALEGVDFARHWIEWILVEAHAPAEVERVLREWYRPVATLARGSGFEDMLYRRRYASTMGEE